MFPVDVTSFHPSKTIMLAPEGVLSDSVHVHKSVLGLYDEEKKRVECFQLPFQAFILATLKGFSTAGVISGKKNSADPQNRPFHWRKQHGH